MKKLGILIHQLSGSQQFVSMCHNLNNICKNNREIDVVVFFNDLGKNSQINEFAIMQSVEALDYDGILIATDNITAHLLDNCICATKKYFYIWNIDWHIQNRPVNNIQNIYLNPNTELIARSKDHAKLISRVFREPKYIIEEFDHEEIIRNII